MTIDTLAISRGRFSPCLVQDLNIVFFIKRGVDSGRLRYSCSFPSYSAHEKWVEKIHNYAINYSVDFICAHLLIQVRVRQCTCRIRQRLSAQAAALPATAAAAAEQFERSIAAAATACRQADPVWLDPIHRVFWSTKLPCCMHAWRWPESFQTVWLQSLFFECWLFFCRLNKRQMRRAHIAREKTHLNGELCFRVV